MFYSHEVLTSRKYGVATIWLVATLGAKSTTSKKVTRKAILNVDVSKACETILEPEVPLALRLQSNLLYGVTRVYSQQCGYVLADAQSTQNNIRTSLVTISRDVELDPEVGRTRPDQLVLNDDPSYLPDFALAPLDIDDLGLEPPSLTRSSSLASLRHSRSPHRSLSQDDRKGSPLLGIQVPSSDNGDITGIGGFVVPGDEGPEMRLPGGSVLHVEDEGFEPGIDFGFDEEGNLIEHASADKLQRTPLTGTRPGLLGRGVTLPSSSAASARVRQEHEEAQQFAAVNYGEQMDIDLPMGDEDGLNLLPEAEPFPSARGRLSSATEPQETDAEVADSSSAVQVPVRRQQKRRIIQMDTTMELRNSNLAAWMNDYVENMHEAKKKGLALRLATQAKRNAEYWVLGLGIGGIGGIMGNTGLDGPLDRFRGDTLLLSLGIQRSVAKKRGRQSPGDEDESEDEGRRVRRRSDEEEVGRGDVGMEDGGIVNVEEEEVDVEAAREAQPEQEERDISQMFPWNVTASVRNSSLAPSARRALGFGGSGVSTSAGGSVPPGSIGRRGRLVSESPLHGRGRHNNLEPLPSSEADGSGNYTLGDIGADVVVGEDDAFEMPGTAAAADTQTATDSQVALATFAKEMENFGIFIFDRLKQKGEVAVIEGSSPAKEIVNEILFDDILPPESTSNVVAAQGFMHLLALTSLGRVSARQDEPFGEIGMSLPFANEAESVP